MRLPERFNGLGAHRGWVALAAVAIFSVLAVAAGSFLPVGRGEGRAREFVLKAHRFSYLPERIRVKTGDRVLVRLQPQDVTHGMYVDGYGVETRAMPTKEGLLDFTASRPGLFRFRCSVTCGPLHPFMVGELNVESGTPHTNMPFLGAAAAALLVGGGTLAYVWRQEQVKGGIAG